MVGAGLVPARRKLFFEEVAMSLYFHQRKPMRQKDHNYTIGCYFITIDTNDRLPLFGKVVDGKMWMNDAGSMLVTCWDEICVRFPNIGLDTFIVMPEHIHGIINMDNPIYSLPDVIQFFKSKTTLHYIKGVRDSRWRGFDSKLWQRNYFERNIRNASDLANTRNYIQENPADYHRFMVEDF